MPSLRSTVTAKAVYMDSSFSAELTIRGSFKRSRSAPSMAMQITPLVYSTMYAIASGVICRRRYATLFVRKGGGSVHVHVCVCVHVFVGVLVHLH
jgi:hypothetical protein